VPPPSPCPIRAMIKNTTYANTKNGGFWPPVSFFPQLIYLIVVFLRLGVMTTLPKSMEMLLSVSQGKRHNTILLGMFRYEERIVLISSHKIKSGPELDSASNCTFIKNAFVSC